MDNIFQNISLNQHNSNKNINNRNRNNIFHSNSGINAEDPLYVMTIELEEGKSANIKIFLDSKPEELAFNFCKENNLDYSAMSYLISQIKNLMENFANSILLLRNSDCIEEVDEEFSQPTSSKKAKPLILSSKNDEIERIINLSNHSEKDNDNNNSNEEKEKKNGNDDDNNNRMNNKKIFKNLNAKSLSSEKHTLFSYESFFNQIKAKNGSKMKKNKIKPVNNFFYFNYTKKKENIDKGANKKNDPPHHRSFIAQRMNNSSNKNSHCKKEDKNEKKENIKNEMLIKGNKSTNELKQQSKKVKNNFKAETIYERSIKHSENENKKIQILKENLIKKEKELYTFKPLLNSHSTKLIRRRNLSHLQGTKKENITNYKKIVQNKINKIKDKYKLNDSYLNFTPICNKKSIQIDKKRNISPKERINLLYSSKKLSTKKLHQIEDEMYSNCSFIPHLNEYPFGNLNTLPFDERQAIYRSKSQEKINKLKKEINDTSDKDTGQELFKPHLYNTNLSLNSTQKGQSVFNKLYSYADKYKLNKTKACDMIISKEKENRKLQLSNSSQKIFNSKKLNTFIKIFKLLDSDNDGQITLLSMNLTKLPPTIIEIIQPIINEIKDEKETLNQEEFLEYCYELFDMLNYKEKQNILNFGCTQSRAKTNTDNINFTFHPKINKNSRKMNYNNFSMTQSINKYRDEVKESKN